MFPLAPSTVVRITSDGQWHLESAHPHLAILPGSFNPLHAGHRELACVAAAILQQAVVFELSIANVDKPSLEPNEVERRIIPFRGYADVWLSHAPTFAEKAARFPRATFIVGADTAQRILSPKYYGDDPKRMDAALESIDWHGCRFLVACRVDSAGKLQLLTDLAIPEKHRAMFTEIPPDVFRWDISSTALREAR